MSSQLECTVPLPTSEEDENSVSSMTCALATARIGPHANKLLVGIPVVSGADASGGAGSTGAARPTEDIAVGCSGTATVVSMAWLVFSYARLSRSSDVRVPLMSFPCAGADMSSGSLDAKVGFD